MNTGSFKSGEEKRNLRNCIKEMKLSKEWKEGFLKQKYISKECMGISNMGSCIKK